MKSPVTRLLSLLLVTLFTFSPAFATCGGGGGGGGGGVNSSSGQQVYYVPWKVREPKDPPASGLILYWFPLTTDELKKSSLRESRALSLYASQCVSMELADYRTPEGQKLLGDSKPPVAVLTTPAGSPLAKAEGADGILKVAQVEKLVAAEVKQRESALDAKLKEAKEKAKAGETAAAVELLRPVLEQKCMFPGKAKDAAKELKKLGATDVAYGTTLDAPLPIFDPAVSARIERLMHAGLRAEVAARYTEAERLYSLAHRLDPADPAPLRYLGELYRHHTGQWGKAYATFNAILRMPADPLSRAVAQHGLGKMTIHDGDFKRGLWLMENSIKSYPLPLTYRNLAVYWNSEGDRVKTGQYVEKAMALDPDDSYNLIFAAAFMAGSGRGDEALKIARENERLLSASYNLAAIYAQLGQREKALAMLRRHFFEFERYHAVRAKEMMEARVDAVFSSLYKDADFLALTRGADGKLPLPSGSMGGSR
jgi:tetratricopeptide (TPR) repeat protein